MPPRLSYVICTAPRTGSTLLAHALAATGIAGHPNEYFDIHAHNEQFWIDRLAIADAADYLPRAIDAGTTANGVFGLKLLWHQSPALLARLKAAAPDLAGTADSLSDPLLAAAFGSPVRYVWLRRRDKLAQAISYYRASRTGRWRATDQPSAPGAPEAEPPFDFDTITRHLRLVEGFDQSWQAFFRRNRLKVLMMIYENFIGAHADAVLSVLDFIGVDRSGVTVGPPGLARQADALSDEWQRRYLEMLAARQRPAGRAAAAADAPAASTDAAAPAPRAGRKGKRQTVAGPALEPLPFTAYALVDTPAPLVKARQERDWMEATSLRFAYRCLPMMIANQSGWMILNPRKFSLVWTGGPDTGALRIQYLDEGAPDTAISLFGGGILTFTIGYLFRTPPGYNLHVRGPANSPKDGIAPLEGIVESDWTEATFTMNWKVTRPNHPLVFEAGEPIAMLSPIRRGEMERFRPELHGLAENPELAELHRAWAQSRFRHNAELKVPGSQARKEGWQRHYFRGTSIDQRPASEHQTKLTLTDFTDKRQR